MKNLLVAVISFIVVAMGCKAQDDKPEFENPLHILVFSKTVGFRHESISSGLKMLYDKSKKQNWIITATENSDLFNDDFLSGFDITRVYNVVRIDGEEVFSADIRIEGSFLYEN